ncbi:universal stress protein [Kitasatospora sp. NPDC051853]|uniref:universal stress protein n=1 Tax=Kitasatospora sp. NPDC051853 TaxID=3364058 RepID=UPI0037A81B31
MTGTIVAGYDGSPASIAAAGWAAHEAGKRKVPLRLVQAWPWAGEHVLGREDAVRWGREGLAAEADGLRERGGGTEVTGTQVPGDPVDVLVEAGRGSSMLVLGSHGLGALRGFLTGSVSRRVLGRADCPVVLVRSGEPVGDRAGAEVVVGLSLRHPGERSVDFACRTAAARSARLRVVHAWHPAGGSDYLAFASLGPAEAELDRDRRRAVAEAVAPWRGRYPGLEITESVVPGPVALTLLDAAAGRGLLVLGRHDSHLPVGTHLGSVVQAALHHAQGPVAVVPEH